MPAMLRPNKKATKIVYAILGKPNNTYDKPIFKNRQTDAALIRQETYRIK